MGTDGMRRIFYKFIANFIFPKAKRKSFKSKHIQCVARIKANMEENNIKVPLNRNIKINVTGKNNIIYIDKDIDEKSVININLCGSDNLIKIGKSYPNLNLNMGSKDNRAIYNSKFLFGKGSYCAPMNEFCLMENNTKIIIGQNCMFSFNVEARCTDDHAVLDSNNRVLNLADSIEIGDHVWLCKEVLILKNTTIPNGCIVGAKSVVANKRFAQSNVAICGNPAKIVKEGISWDGARPDLYKSEDFNHRK